MSNHITISPIEGTVTASLADGTVIAESTNAVSLVEGSIGPRTYIPRADVNMDLLTATSHATHCPFKGQAAYWSIGDNANAVWSYENPIDAVPEIAGHMSFYDSVVNVSVA